MPESIEEEKIDLITVSGYKYYKDGIAHIVTHEDRTYDMFLNNSSKIPIGKICKDIFEVTVPGEERNFIKKNDRLNLKVNGIDGRIYHDSIDMDSCTDGDFDFSMHLSDIRDKYISRMLSKSSFDYTYDILTLSIGNKSYISSEFFDALQKLGIYHLYVISGTHVAFVSGILFFTLKRMRFTINVIKMMMIVCLLLFLSLNFFSPSVFRAVLMAILLIVTSFFRQKPYLTVISLTAIFQILYNPWVMYHAGFQLSYITTYLIILSRTYWQDRGPFIQLMGITAIAEVSTLTIVLQQFNEISISGIIMNFFFVPLFSFIIFPMVIIYNFMVFTVFPVFADEIYHFVFTLLKDLIFILADGIKHRFSVKSPNALWLILLIILSYMIIKEICLGNFKRTTFYSAAFILCMLLLNKLSWFDYTVTMVDVGQGDAFIVEDHKNNAVVLIDTGGKFYPEESQYRLSDKTVLPYLKESGVDRIDMMILSHMDLDHTGEADYILQKKQVDYIYVNPSDPAFSEWYQSDVPESFDGQFINAMDTRTIDIGDMQITKLFPLKPVAGEDSNQHSLVVMMHAGQFSFLFTGDIDVDIENELIDTYGQIETDILKLAHHGSNTSTGEAFVENTSFKYALVSAGVNNRYGHPHPEVVQRVDSVQVFDTSRHGMVRFHIKGRKMCVETKLQPGLNHCIKKELN
ncbi:DNA internalization-related competence protein ComEC/Rec2 [Salinicoccus sp. HZC-1]|uniref:DNA internalization-related competence protein ComEC/Rec2 n=1 Tax=Salinicoccus sp. HZC-1 TaxID=3385497 RepID=UPI00398BBA5F